MLKKSYDRYLLIQQQALIESLFKFKSICNSRYGCEAGDDASLSFQFLKQLLRLATLKGLGDFPRRLTSGPIQNVPIRYFINQLECANAILYWCQFLLAARWRRVMKLVHERYFRMFAYKRVFMFDVMLA